MLNLKARGIAVAAFALVLSASASADMVTFWKTDQCPVFGTKIALFGLAGTMEAPVNRSTTGNIISVGGPYCNLDGLDTTGLAQKTLRVTNASIVPSSGMVVGAWDCVVCQYPNKVIFLGAAMPAVSISALAFLGGGLAIFGLARLRRRQAQTTG